MGSLYAIIGMVVLIGLGYAFFALMYKVGHYIALQEALYKLEKKHKFIEKLRQAEEGKDLENEVMTVWLESRKGKGE